MLGGFSTNKQAMDDGNALEDRNLEREKMDIQQDQFERTADQKDTALQQTKKPEYVVNAAGLYADEKRYVFPFVFFATVFFCRRGHVWLFCCFSLWL